MDHKSTLAVFIIAILVVECYSIINANGQNQFNQGSRGKKGNIQRQQQVKRRHRQAEREFGIPDPEGIEYLGRYTRRR